MLQLLASYIGRSGLVLKTPTSDGSSGQAIVTDGNLNLSFASIVSSAAGSGTELQYRLSATSLGAITGSSWSAGVLTVPTLAVTDLTATRIPYVGTAGRMSDSANLTWDNTNSRLGINVNSSLFADLQVKNANSSYAVIAVGNSSTEYLQIAYPNAANASAIVRVLPASLGLDVYGASVNFYQTATVSPFASFTSSQNTLYALSAAMIPLAINLYSGQTAAAIQVTSYGGTAGDRFKVAANGNTTVSSSFNALTIGAHPITGSMGIWGSPYSVYFHGALGPATPANIGWGVRDAGHIYPTYDTQMVQWSGVAIVQNAAGVIEVNNGTANQYRDILVRSIGLGVTPPGTTGDVRILGTAYGGNGSKISDITWENGGNYRAGIRTVYDTTTANYGGSFEFYTGGQSTTWPGNLNKSLVVAGSGATTINAASGNPLTVQANGTTKLLVDSTGSVLVGGASYSHAELEVSSASTMNSGNANIAFFSSNEGYNALGLALSHSSQSGRFSMRLTSTIWGVSGNDIDINNSSSDLNGGLTVKYNGNIGAGTINPSAQIHAIKTTEQLRLGYDAANYFSTTVASNGTVTMSPHISGGGTYPANLVLSDSVGGNPGWSIGDLNTSPYISGSAGANNYITQKAYAYTWNMTNVGDSVMVLQIATGNLGVGVASPSARIHAIKTTEQLRLGYDSNNYLSTTVASNGDTTFAITTGTTTNGFVFSNPVSCPGSGTMSERFGVGANAGSYSLSVGQNSQSDSAGAAFGRSANAAINSVALGNFAYARSHNVAIGDSATAGSYLGSIAIGESATCTTSGQMVVGSASLPVNSMKLITDSIGGSLNFGVTSGNLTITPSGTGELLISNATSVRAASFITTSKTSLISDSSGIALGVGSSGSIYFASTANADSGSYDIRLYRSAANSLQISANTTTLAGTVGTKILSLVSTATNDDPTLDVYQNRVATTDATVTTLHTIAIADETAYALTATVLARRTGGVSGTAGDSALYTFQACVMRTGAGIATLVGTSTPIVTLESQAGWDCVFDVDGGNNARVRVTGAVGNNITFHLVELKVSPLSS